MRRTRRRVISTAPQKNIEVEPGSYVVDLQGQWRLSTTIANPDSSLYDGVYESFSNKGQAYSTAIMRIYINGLTEFKFYVRSYAESSYDYVVVSNLDCNLSSGTTSGTNVKLTTSGKQNSGATIESYQLVEFTNIDGGQHFITVMYRKDSGVNNGTDQGYLLIPKIKNIEPAPEAHSYLTVTYKPNTTTADTIFYSTNFDATQLVSMEIDGVNDSSLPTSKRFTSTGTTCTVRYGFHENLTSCAHFFEGARCITSVDVTEWDSSKVTDMSYMFASAGTSMTLTPSTWNTSNVTDMSYMFYSAGLSTTNFTGFNVSNVTNMRHMFSYAWSSHVSVNFTGWDTSKVTDMSYMFYQVSLSGSSGFNTWNTINVTNMSHMFYGKAANQTNKLNLTGWDTSNVTNMSNMFYFCKYLQNISGLTDWNVGKVTDMNHMFYNCQSASTIGDLSNWNVSNVTNMANMFDSCSSLTSLGDLSNWNVSKVTDMHGMFRYCERLSLTGINNWRPGKLKDISDFLSNATKATGDFSFIINNWDLSEITSLESVFEGCSGITSVGEFGTVFANKYDTTKLTSTSRLFSGCSGLTSVGDFTNWSLSACEDTSYMFNVCSGLTSIGDLSNLLPNGGGNYAYMFANCQGLTSIGDLSGWRVRDSLYTDGDYINLKAMFKNCRNLTNVGDLSDLTWTKKSQSVTLDSEALQEIFCNCEKLSDIGQIGTYWNIKRCQNAASAFKNCFKFTNLGSFKSLGSSMTSITNISHMFDRCGVLTSGYSIGDFSNWKTSAMTDMSYFLNVCELDEDENPSGSIGIANVGELTSIGNISGWNVSNVTNMAFAFAGQHKIDFNGDDTFLNWNTSKVTNMSGMFALCSAMFNNVNRMNSLRNWDTSKVTDMSYMFYCAGLNTNDIFNSTSHQYSTNALSGWTTSALTNMREMFKGCYFDLTSSMKYWDVSNVTNMSGLFACGAGGIDSLTDSSLNNLSGWTTTSLTNVSYMFMAQGKLLAPSIRWDLTNVTDMHNMFEDCELRSAWFYTDIPNVTNCNLIFDGVYRDDTTLYGVYCPASAKSNYESKMVPNFPTRAGQTWQLNAIL